ncbi:MAG: ABC transporter ATP-binding protein [Acidimicrobiia bacterium]|nr:ABC transporter ATP-binding protein [Acidimicrobiia bacterium]MDH5503630.1 ABC transporter ATP-binding protein [Acidimicrobiia bacterium]
MLEVRDVTAGYGKAQALWGLSLEVAEGEIVTIVGPNGAGKSTLVNVIGGLQAAWSGSIVLDDQELTGLATHRVCASGVAVVPEGRRVFPEMSVTDNLDMGAYHREARQYRDETYEYVCGIFPRLAERSEQLAGSLSGGEQQMLAIGRAMMSRPKLLLLDEPSLGLAPVIVETIFDIIRDINQTGTSILLVEQNVVEGLELASRGYVLEEGRIVREGAAADLLDDEELQASYFGM